MFCRLVSHTCFCFRKFCREQSDCVAWPKKGVGCPKRNKGDLKPQPDTVLSNVEVIEETEVCVWGCGLPPPCSQRTLWGRRRAGAPNTADLRVGSCQTCRGSPAFSKDGPGWLMRGQHCRSIPGCSSPDTSAPSSTL